MQRTRYDRERLFEKIIGTLDRMPNDMRTAFILRRYQRLAPEEIAGRLGIAPGQLDFLLAQADEHLRKAVHPLVVGEEDIVSACARGSIGKPDDSNWKSVCT